MEIPDKLQNTLDSMSFADLSALRNELEKVLSHEAINKETPIPSLKTVRNLNLFVCNEIGNRLRYLHMLIK